MTYTITVANQAAPINIQQGVSDNSTSLTLVGKNYPNYGQLLQQDLVNLLQNFAGSGAPTNPVTGQLWYNFGTSILQIYNGNVWRSIASLTNSVSAPTNGIQGDLWYDSTNQQLNVYTGSNWILVGPTYTSSQQKTTASALTIPAVGGGSPTVLAFYIGNTIIGILSGSATFTPVTNISGFTTVQPGYNVSTNIFAGAPPVTGQILTNAQPYITSVGTLTSLTVSGAINTTGNGTYNIGTNANKFGTVYATAQTALYADLAENYVSDDVADPTAIMIIGGDEEVTPSTISHDPRVIGVMSQNPAYLMNTAIDGIGSAIALTGRVPVRVKGPVNKGDCIVSSDIAGVGEKLDMFKYTPGCIVGKTLDSIDDNSIKTIEVVVGIR
jgi:hypothetical protein